MTKIQKNKASLLHVAVGVVFNSQRQVLVALRPRHADQGNLWEFPGGKVEAGETVEEALVRELYEEIGITVTSVSSLLTIEHQYPNKKVFLDVWEVLSYEGEPYAKEDQVEVKWVSLAELSTLAIPVANHPIVRALVKS